MTDQELQKLFELIVGVLLEVRVGQVKLDRKFDKILQEIRELQKQPPDS